MVILILLRLQIVSESGPTIVHSTSQSYASEIELFRSLAGDSDAEILEIFLKQINSGVNDDILPIVFSPDTDKTHRTVSSKTLFVNVFAHLFLRIVHLLIPSNNQCRTSSLSSFSSSLDYSFSF